MRGTKDYRARANAVVAEIPDEAPESAPLKEYRPNKGPQEQFLATKADIAIYGGAAGGGKSTALLWEAGRHVHIPGYNAVLFRRTHPEIINPGGMWDESQIYYPSLGGIEKHSSTTWNFPWNGSVIKMNHMQLEADRFKWQGSQICMLGFDELTHFTMQQFFYMLSRNRSMCGVKPYIRATCNPDPDSWVREFLDWWIGEDGFPIPERIGKLRWMGRKGDTLIWANTRMEILRQKIRPKSVTFIPALLSDNPQLCEADPDYESNLDALPRHERERLKGGNWDARAVAGDYFKRAMFEVVDAAPKGGRSVRWWDRASTVPSAKNPDPDYTAGVKITEYQGQYFIEDIVRLRGNPTRVQTTIKATASQEPDTEILLPQDPGAAGKSEVDTLIKKLKGFNVTNAGPETGDKATRAVPVSAQCGAGNVFVVRGKWNKEFFAEAELFDGSGDNHDDQIDGLSGGFNYLVDAPELGRVRRV